MHEIVIGQIVKSPSLNEGVGDTWLVTGTGEKDGRPVVDLVSWPVPANIIDVNDLEGVQAAGGFVEWRYMDHVTPIHHAEISLMEAYSADTVRMLLLTARLSPAQMKEIDDTGRLTDVTTHEPTSDTTLVRTAVDLRALRERLKLSRKNVQDGTGLSSSVVWRVEQSGKSVTNEQWLTIFNFLTAYAVEHPHGKPAKTPTPTASQSVAAERDEWVAKALKLSAIITEAVAAAQAGRAAAVDAKRSTKHWDAVLESLKFDADS